MSFQVYSVKFKTDCIDLLKVLYVPVGLHNIVELLNEAV